jgi:signal transduction histidine kinase/PAS domain-containing protein
MAALRAHRDRPTSGREPEDTGRATALDAIALLDTLGAAVVCLRPDHTVSAVNAAAAAALGAGTRESIGQSFWTALPMLHDERGDEIIRRTADDGKARSYRVSLPGGRADAMNEIRVSRLDPGWIVLEIRDRAPASRRTKRPAAGEADPAAAAAAAAAEERERLVRELGERRGENHALRSLARQMAEVTDSETLLRILCRVVMSWCSADGAGVGEVEGQGGVVITALGIGAPEAGATFRIPGSLAERAIRERRIIVEADYATSNPQMREWANNIGVGEMMVAPLFAAERVVGVLNAWRRRGAEHFSDGDCDRLRVIGDHAAVAVAKARLVEEAHAASLARSNFLAAVSHELRTPLTALAGYGELLADDILGALSPAQHETIERMRTVTHQLSALIDEILTYSSLEAGCEVARPTETTSEDIFSSAVAMMEPLARQKGLTLTTSIPPLPTAMYTDGEMARQILVNLIGNAIKFTDTGGVDVSLTVQSDEVRFAVTDTGIGIGGADLQRLFQPFTQIDGGLTRRHGGTGLGLYISRRLALLLEGRIEVGSSAGEGSTFTLVVPVRMRATRVG